MPENKDVSFFLGGGDFNRSKSWHVHIQYDISLPQNNYKIF
jgi:hypothetical protein